jgi:hypothetical protein
VLLNAPALVAPPTVAMAQVIRRSRFMVVPQPRHRSSDAFMQ